MSYATPIGLKEQKTVSVTPATRNRMVSYILRSSVRRDKHGDNTPKEINYT